MTNPGQKSYKTNKKILKYSFWGSKTGFFSNYAKYFREESQSKPF